MRTHLMAGTPEEIGTSKYFEEHRQKNDVAKDNAEMVAKARSTRSSQLSAWRVWLSVWPHQLKPSGPCVGGLTPEEGSVVQLVPSGGKRTSQRG